MKRYNLVYMQSIARRKGGKCLSSEYHGVKAALQWQCANGHTWFAPPNRLINQNGWCPKCATEKRSIKSRLGLEYLQKIAKDRGGKCLATTYGNNYTKVDWQCELGHRWSAIPGAVIGSKNQRGSWCPYCNDKSRGEEICRAYFKYIFGADFPRIQPRWLRSEAGYLLQLDGYNEKLCIAFEYQGPHHYRDIPYFYGNKRNRLEDQKKRDRLKKELCLEHGVTLIEVSEKTTGISEEDFGHYILRQCRKAELKIKEKLQFNKMDKSSMWTPRAIRKLAQAKNIAQEKGGICLSEMYDGALTPLRWQCKNGHQWNAQLNKIRAGGWCQKCFSEMRKRTLDDAKELAESKNGTCLSTEYINTNSKLKWKCKLGHVWESPFFKIKGGRWCPNCARRNRGISQRATIEEMKLFAVKRKGQCISKEYSGAHRHLNWECKLGHRWEATPNSIRRGSWCPTCAGKNKNIYDARNLARKKKGHCLSLHYFNSTAHLRWQCGEGHQWRTSFENIKSGKWCPTCAIKKRGNALRGNIEEMRLLAKGREGRCLSLKYANANSHLEWKCKNGHRWRATPGHIKSGTWCAICAK